MIMIVVYILLGLLAGCMLTFLILTPKRKSVESQLTLLENKLEWELNRAKEISDELQNAKLALQENATQISNLQVEKEKMETRLITETRHRQEEEEMRTQQFEQQIKTVQEQFVNLANKVLESTSQKLKAENNEAMEHITTPLKQNLEQLQQAIRHSDSETAKNTASLTQQLKLMLQQTQRIDEAAGKLTRVIKGDKNVQGKWGEDILNNLLDYQGFKKGLDYDVQETLTDEKGYALTADDTCRRMIPDVILHYPHNEDVVIDAKVSIGAYYDYVNAEVQELKNKYADDLVKNIRTQALKLSKKDYGTYVKSPRRAIDFVIMFVPHEGALHLALARDPKLWLEAFDRQVLITGQQNLCAILKMIQIAWRQYTQTENQKKIFLMAEELLKRVGDFIIRFDKVGKDLASIEKNYHEAYKKVYTGRQSIVQKAVEIKELGVKETLNKPIPQAEIEVDEVVMPLPDLDETKASEC